MEKNLLEDEDYKLWWLLLQTRRALHKMRAKELSQHGISPEEVMVLFCIKSAGHQSTCAEISRWILRANITTHGLITRMVKKGLVTKVKDIEPRNLVRIAITEKGQEAYSKSINIISIKKLLSILSKEESDQFRLTLVKFRNAAMKEVGNNNRPPFPVFE